MTHTLTYKEKFELISQIADKILERLKEDGLPLREKWQIVLDFENVDKVCPLDFELLARGSEETLWHDYCGICKYFDRTTLQFKEDSFFVPRSSIGERMKAVNK